MSAQEIVNASIAIHGGEAYKKLDLDFAFRDKNYRIRKDGDRFRYERIFTEDSQKVVDILENGVFQRSIDGKEISLPDSTADKYASSVNSVAYFVLLPEPLNDPAVEKTLLGRSEINGVDYYKVKVSFKEEGGGKDFEDTYLYWFHPETHTMDYLAYDYKVNGGGLRFRKAYNIREVAGIRMQDYINYKGDPKRFKVEESDRLFEEGKLEELSRIEIRPL